MTCPNAAGREMVGKYGSQFYEGFRMFYISCAEAFAANDGDERPPASKRR